MDMGGLMKEFVESLAQAGFDRNRGLFSATPDGFAYPNPLAGAGGPGAVGQWASLITHHSHCWLRTWVLAVFPAPSGRLRDCSEAFSNFHHCTFKCGWILGWLRPSHTG